MSYHRRAAGGIWRSLCVDAAVKSEAIGREVMDGNGFSRVMALTFFNVSEDSY